MALLTEAHKKRFAEIGTQWHEEDPIVVVKLISNTKGVFWLFTDYIEHGNIAYGYVQGLPTTGDQGAWGYFMLDELEHLRLLPNGDRAKLDPNFKEMHLSEALAQTDSE